MDWSTPESDDLFRTILSLKNEAELKRFFRDLLTEKEILEFSNRWQAARMLNDKVPYTQIVKETGLSSTTVARIAKWLKGDGGGYRIALFRLEHPHTPPRLG
ncbi:MAG: YerC/YecD family TrpR-related protein [bacterium]